MLWFLLFVACVWILIFLFIKLKKKFFDPFIAASLLRLSIWKWTKRVILLALTANLLVSTFERWYYFHDDIAHSKKSLEIELSYADQVEIEAFLTPESNVADLFQGKLPPEMTEDPKNKSTGKICYVVIRIKNKGDLPIYGTLTHNFQDIDVPPLPPNMSDFKSIIVWKYSFQTPILGSYEKLELKWKKIYTIKENK